MGRAQGKCMTPSLFLEPIICWEDGDKGEDAGKGGRKSASALNSV